LANHICHVEIPTTNFEKAKSFYSKIFGWKVNLMPDMNYASFETGSEPGGGFNKVDKVTSSGEEGVLIYISVDEIHQTLARITELGGNVIKEKTEIPETGWYALFVDPEGNVIGIFQPRA
jgi:predicted enzyme related to lactoylglutathione lyase